MRRRYLHTQRASYFEKAGSKARFNAWDPRHCCVAPAKAEAPAIAAINAAQNTILFIMVLSSLLVLLDFFNPPLI